MQQTVNEHLNKDKSLNCLHFKKYNLQCPKIYLYFSKMLHKLNFFLFFESSHHSGNTQETYLVDLNNRSINVGKSLGYNLFCLNISILM